MFAKRVKGITKTWWKSITSFIDIAYENFTFKSRNIYFMTSIVFPMPNHQRS